MADIPSAVQEPQFSLCMIVRDEEDCLRTCLESFAPWVHEICIVDTGSRDRSLSIAKEFGAKTLEIDWRDDFSHARNASLELATKDWIIVADADEQLAKGSGEALSELARSGTADAHLISQDNLDDEGNRHSRLIARLFRNGAGVEFSRRVHESVVDSIAERGLLLEREARIHLIHTGYLAAVVSKRRKHERNDRILRREIENNPHDLYSIHKLTMMLPHDSTERLVLAVRACELANRVFEEGCADEYPFLPRVYANLVATQVVHGDLVAALVTVGVGLGRFPGNGELRFQQADLALRIGYDEGAQQLFEFCLDAPTPPPAYPADPAMRGLAAAIGIARAAVSGRRLRDALVAVRKIRRLAPASGVERALTLEILSMNGQRFAMLEKLATTLDSPLVETAPVQLVVGDHAWSEGDHTAALAMWRNAAGRLTSVGQEATCRLALGEVCVDTRGAADGLATVGCWSLNAEAARIALSMLAGLPPEPTCNALPVGGLLLELAGWLAMIECSGRRDLLEKVAEELPNYETVLPGVGMLIEQTAESLAS